MLSLEEYKKILSKTGDDHGLTEEEIIRLKDNQEQMAELFFNSWLKDKNLE